LVAVIRFSLSQAKIGYRFLQLEDAIIERSMKMTMTGLAVFDKTIHISNEWLKDLMFEMNWAEKHKAYTALRVCLHALRDRLTTEEAAHLGAQLPMLIRGLYYEGWKPSATPEKIRDAEAFLSRIQNDFQGSDLQVEDTKTTTRAVFKLLFHRISEGEVQDIKQIIPEDLRNLWPKRV
jgi:uncharacterized protein (DUF2267 family)